tara:strand:+ start:1798 stop:2730 length:933 start_codon:yes stop_codon:yes gene_type:complete
MNSNDNKSNLSEAYNKLEAKYLQAVSDYDKLLDRINTLANHNGASIVDAPIKYSIDDRWRNWIAENLASGIPPKQLAQTLIEQNYSYDIIAQELNIQQFPNPLNTIQFLNQNKSAQKVNVDFPLYVVKDFLNKKQTQSLIALIKENTGVSTISNQSEATLSVRKSNSCYLEELQDPLVNEVQNKICDLLNIPVGFTEAMQGQFYESGGYYHKHWDASSIDDPDYVDSIRAQGNRTWTALINLNVPKDGGETGFFDHDLMFKPAVGQLLIWYNLDLETHLLNQSTAHGGKPVNDGEKLIVTQWFRQFNRLI